MRMGKLIRIFFLAFALVVYFFMFNVVIPTLLDFYSVSDTFNGGNISQSSTTEQAFFGDSVEVRVFHDGLLWNIETFSYQDYKDSKILFFGFIPLPLIIRDFNLFYIHLIAAIIFFLIFLKIIFSTERGYYG